MMAGFRAVFTWSAVLGAMAILTSLVGRPREARKQTVPGSVPGAPAAGVPATQTAELSPVRVIEGE
jgi:hypothetical protein